MKYLLALLCVALVGCDASVTPAMIRDGEKLCAEHNGLNFVVRDNQKGFRAKCKDGVMFTVNTRFGPEQCCHD